MTAATLALAGRESRAELLKALRTPEYVIPTLVFPPAFYALFGLALARDATTTTYLMATYGVFAALGPALFGFATSVAYEREQGLLALKRVFPMPAWAYPVAKLATALTMTLILLIVLYALAVFAGGVRLTAGAWGLMLGVHLASVFPFALMGMALGYSLKGQGAMAISNVLFFLLCIVGGLWIPLHVLPGWMGQVALLLPSYHLAELALTVIGYERGPSTLTHLGVIALWCALMAGAFALAQRRAAM